MCPLSPFLTVRHSATRTTVFLPLSPTRLAALGRTDRFEAVGARAVRQANARQVTKARDYVYMHPGSGLDAFVASATTTDWPGTTLDRLAGHHADLDGRK